MQKKQLQQKIRRSSSISPNAVVQYYLEYATLVRDQRQVYEFMEQNSIGVNDPKYWLCRFKHLAQLCQFNQIAKLMKKIRENRQVRTHPSFSEIISFESETISQLKRIYLSKHHGRRSIKQYQLFMKVQNKNPRKIGGMDIWVDEPFQEQFALQDYAQVIENKFPNQKRNAYMRYEQEHKHLQYSFVHQAQEDLQKKSSGLLQKAQPKPPLNYRKSLRTIDNIQQQAEKQKNSQTPTPTKNRCRTYEDDKLLDSVQIIYKRNLWKRNQSPRFNQQGSHSNVRRSRDRQSWITHQQLPQIPRCQTQNRQQFSFHKRRSANNFSRDQINQAQQIEPSVMETQEEYDRVNNQARIQPNSVMQSSKNIQQYSFQLGLLINQCQREKYQKQNNQSCFPMCESYSNVQNQDIRSIQISSIRAQKRKNNQKGGLMVMTPQKQEQQCFENENDIDAQKSYKGTMEQLLQNIDQQNDIFEPTPHFKRANNQRRISMSERPNRSKRQQLRPQCYQERNGFTYSFLPSQKRGRS